VSEFVHIRVEDLFLDDDPPQIHITHAKGNADRYVPALPALAQELRTHLENRRRGWLFESNRHQRYAVRSVQAWSGDVPSELGSANGCTHTYSAIR
jgi:integrase/recombinase XerD